MLKEVFKNFVLFWVGFVVYICIELSFRGFSHWSMGIVGGLSFILVGGINNYLDYCMPLWKQALIGALGITSLEFISGVLLNKILLLNIWDYSSLRWNIWGIVCPQFFFAWYGLAIIAIFLDDFLRWKWFDEEKPHYHLWKEGQH